MVYCEVKDLDNSEKTEFKVKIKFSNRLVLTDTLNELKELLTKGFDCTSTKELIQDLVKIFN